MSKVKLDTDKIDKMLETVRKKQQEGKIKGEESIQRFSKRIRSVRRRLRR
ncbi:MAG: hypothetical protein ACE5FV_11740 [Woeseia sp.]